MRIQMRAHEALKRAEELYARDSKPISVVGEKDEPLKIEWWESNPQAESSESDRHKAGMLLYLELATRATPQLGPDCFPARFDFEGGKSMRPDKGIIKVFLREHLVAHRMLGAQLIFDLTEAGRQFRDGVHAGTDIRPC